MKNKKSLFVLCLVVFILLIGAAAVLADDAGEIMDAEPVSDGKLTVWVAGNTADIQEAFNQVIENFNQNNPKFSVTVEFIPWGDLSTKLTTALSANVGPDLFMHGVAASAGFMDKGQIEDLTRSEEQLPDRKSVV